MADEETPTPEEKPKRRRAPRRRKAADAPVAETGRASGTDGEAAASDATVSETDASAAPEGEVDEIDPTPEDDAAEDEAADVMLEAEDEIDSDSGGESEEEAVAEEKPARRPRRRRSSEPKQEAPAKPAPTRRRARRDPNLPPPVVRAQAKYIRSSARKARFVCDHIRGKSVEEARAILATAPRAVARDWSKLLESAVANAENNHELVGEDLYIKAVHADEGPTIKRFRPRAMGRATRIRKRTSHLTILLTPKD
jgi:ribosomal protein L22